MCLIRDKIFLTFLLLCSVVILMSGEVDAAGQDTRNQISKRIEFVSGNKKMRTGGRLSKSSLMEGQSLRVIVKLSSPPLSQRQENIQNRHGRAELHKTVNQTTEAVTQTLDKKEAQILRKFSYINGFAAQVSLAGLEELLTDERVQAVFEDKLVSPMTNQGLALIRGSIPRSRYDGSGVSIAILDTGIDYNHPMLGGGGFPNSKVIGGTDTGDNDSDPFDAFGHGTACAGIAAGNLPTSEVGDYIGGVAPGAKLYAVKISHSDSYGSPTGYAWTSDILEALEWCITHQYDDPANPILIANISFGLGGYSSSCDSDSYAEVGVETIQNANFAGISIFASSGNNGYTQSLSLPACYSGVISVGAVYDDVIGDMSYSTCNDETAVDKVACYSNSSPDLDLLAPGHNAYTTDTIGNSGMTTGDYDPYFGGTSASSPYAAGSAAVMQSAAFTHRGTSFSHQDIRLILTTTGDLIPDHRNSIVKPRVNLHAALSSFLSAGDVNGDGATGIADSIDSLRLLSGSSYTPLSLYSDVNGDNRIGMEEALYSMRYTAGMICMKGHLDACASSEECNLAEGFWYDSTCHATPSCDSNQLEQCDSERACTYVGGYWLQRQQLCIPDPRVEAEPNNSRETANKLYLDVPVTAHLSEDTDQDWFMLTADTLMVAKVSFSTTVTSTFWFVSVYDSSGNLISRHDVGNNDSFDVAFPSHGTYYLQISIDATHRNDPYILKVSESIEHDLSNMETEPNNEKTTADTISLNVPITAQLMESSDEDWFSFEGYAANVTISFSTAVSSMYWHISVYDMEDNLMIEKDVGNNGLFTTSLPNPGIYFIVVKKNSFLSDDQYTLTVATD